MGKEYSFHRTCLSSLFLFGNIALFVPYKNAKNGELTAVLIALVISVLLYFLWYFLADKLYKFKSNKAIEYAVCTFVILLSLFANIYTSRNFSDYISDEVLIKNLKISLLVVFAASSIYLVSKPPKVVAKLSLLSFVFIAVTVIVLFAISFKNFEPVGIKQLFCGKFVKRSGYYLIRALWFPIVYAVFSRYAFKEVKIKNDVIGLCIGSMLVIICFLSAVLTFSLSFASDLEFAYPISISVVNIGELFTRMDGFAYFIFYLSALIKSSVCGLTVEMVLERKRVKKPFKITAFLMIASFAISYLL